MSDVARPLVLVVDDTPANIHLLVEALRIDYEVIVATRGRKALELAETEKPDLILLDVVMPEMDGLEVCRALKAQSATRDIPIIFVTGDGDDSSQETGFNTGAVDYVVKPFSLPVVRARVRTHIALKHRTALLEQLAMLDGLTGIANRRRFDTTLDVEWRRSNRHGTLLSIVLLDVDHFKAYNDTYGHGAGDECLRRIAEAISSAAFRPADLAARLGGEEFALLLPDSDASGAYKVAERARHQVEHLHLNVRRGQTIPPVTLSAGFATIFPASAQSVEQLMQNADKQLYRAKTSGRNRVHGMDLNATYEGPVSPEN